MNLASIVIPCYNQARFVGEAVASALAQTYPAVEVIVVDDGSTDDPAAALATYAGRITLLRQGNRGLAGARNAGLARARGDYLLFLDSDDVLEPQALARLVGLLEARPACGLAYCAWRQVDGAGERVLGEVRPGEHADPLRDLLLRRFFFFASTAALRRSCLDRVGGFDADLPWGEDADMWLRVAYAGYQMGYVDAPLVRYRVHTDSMTSDISPRQVAGWQRGLDQFFRLPGLPGEIHALANEAQSVLHFETAGRYYRAGSIDAAKAHLRQAVQLHPTVSADWMIAWVAGTALDPRTGDPQAFIDRVVQNLPPEAAGLISRGQAHGRYHAAALFAAYAGRDWRRVRRHLLPALGAQPRLLRNRGFWSIAAQAMTHR